MERHRVLRAFHVDAERVVRPRDVQRGDVQEHHADQHEWQQIMQAEEAVERRVVHAEPAPQPGHDRLADQRDGGEQVGDDGSTPVRHLAPGQHVAHEGGRHHDEQQQDADDPQQFARILVGAIIQPAEDMDVDHDEEHRRAVLVHVAQQPAIVHVAHDALYAVEGEAGVGHIVHREEDARDDHDRQGDHRQRAEIPEIIEVLRRRECAVFALHHREDGHSRVDPVDHWILEVALVQTGHRVDLVELRLGLSRS